MARKPKLRIIFDIISNIDLRKIYLHIHNVPLIGVKQVQEMITKKFLFYIIDVRYPLEYEDYHIENSLNIPMDVIVKTPNVLDQYMDKKLIFVCTNGRRSHFITQFVIENLNFLNVFNLEGGYYEWNKLEKSG